LLTVVVGRTPQAAADPSGVKPAGTPPPARAN
jgi:zinc protease